MTDRFDWKQRALYDRMSDISEGCYCAGWMHGNEFTLWEMLTDPAASRNYGQDVVTDDDLAELRAISDEIGGWIRWHDDDDEPDLPAGEWGPRFCPLPEWRERYAKHMTRRAALEAAFAARNPTPCR